MESDRGRVSATAQSHAEASAWAVDGTVDVDVVDAVATVTLNRLPGNGWTPALGRQFFAALESAAADEDVRAIIVMGAGPDFCVGADAGSLNNVADNGSYAINVAKPTYWMAMTIGKPVIAAVNGACFGVGMQVALLCDVRFASTSTKFSTAFVRRGLTAELGMTWSLPRIVGLGVANDLLLSGRLVRAAEALELGLVNWVLPPDRLLPAAREYAAEIAATCSPSAVAVVKRQIQTDLTSDLPPAVERGYADMEVALASADFAEGVRSWREKRPPRFGPLDPDKTRFDLPGTQ